MAGFSAHLAQAKSNLDFLASLNSITGKWDWKVTTSFYVAVHLVNAHLAQQADMHFRTHKQVEEAISPFGAIKALHLSDDAYTSHMAIKNLSRRVRYICNPDGSSPESGQATYDKHFKKALHHLDVLLTWFSEKYTVAQFEQMTIVCPELTKNMTHFAVAGTKSAA